MNWVDATAILFTYGLCAFAGIVCTGLWLTLILMIGRASR